MLQQGLPGGWDSGISEVRRLMATGALAASGGGGIRKWGSLRRVALIGCGYGCRGSVEDGEAVEMSDGEALHLQTSGHRGHSEATDCGEGWGG